MRIKKNKKLLIIILACLIVIGGGVGVAALSGIGPFARDNTSDTINTEKPTKEQKDAGDETAKQAKDPEPQAEQKPGTAPDNPATNSPNLTITAVNQNNGMVQIRTLIDRLTSGTCHLSLKKDGREVTRDTETQPLASTATCKGFDIPTTELSQGEWQIEIIFTGENQHATANSTVTVQ